MIHSILLVGFGSFLGGICRFLSTRLACAHLSGMFPFGTFAVNIAGCFLIGIFYGLSEHGFSPSVRLFFTVGFCGGFTTFSTFASESLQLVKAENVLAFALYASLSVFLGILAVHAGNLATRIL